MMGHTEDPKDGGAVAAAVFGAVAVYGVRTPYILLDMDGILRKQESTRGRAADS
jgi:hypothetical protein